MASEISIFSNLRFIGYVQDSAPGKNGQFLRYFDGVATWGNVADDSVHRIVTSHDTDDVLIDGAGNVISYGMDETYEGINTKPPFSTDEPNVVVFLGTQEEYDVQNWVEGDIFIPTVNGIQDTGDSVAVAARINYTTTGSAAGPINRASFYIFTTTNSFNSDLLHLFTRTDTGSGLPTLSSFLISARNNNLSKSTIVRTATAIDFQLKKDVSDPAEAAFEFAELMNTISSDIDNPTNIATNVNIVRNFVALNSGEVLILIYLDPSDTVVIPSFSVTNWFTTPVVVAAIPPQSESVAFIKNTMYIRRQGNNGWIQFATGTNEFIVN